MITGTANLSGNGLDNLLYAGTGNNSLNGALGTDTVSYLYGVTGTTGVNINLALGTAQTTGGSGSDTLTSIENLTGSNNNDILSGNGLANTLNGGGGADAMIGGNGSDSYYVDNSGDVVADTDATATGGIDTIFSALSAYTLAANVENGRIMSTGVANLNGNDLNNLLYAGSGNNIIKGGNGIDTISYLNGATAGVTVSLASVTAQATGGSGNDTLNSIERLIGSKFNDTLTGSSGNNILTGGLGKDILKGNGCNDTFDFNSLAELTSSAATTDVIKDFNAGDKIDLSTLDANSATATNDAFTNFIANSKAFSVAGQLKFDATNHVLYGNTDGDAGAEFALVLTGVNS
jgi:Ca2+-binding RTX toxin-like protein